MKVKNATHKIGCFEIFSPDFLKCTETFLSNEHVKLKNYEKDYFWFSERRRLICFLIMKYFPKTQSFCEIGCGGGYVLSGVKDVLPDAKLSGSEIFLEGLQIAKERNPDAILYQADILDFPFVKEYELLGVFDVIEHIDDDKKAIKSIYDALEPGGGAIITVPQHKWLWTKNDEYACHKRRYTRKELKEKFKHAGFEDIRYTSYTSLLLPAFIINCIFNRNAVNEKNIEKQFAINPILNSIFKIICKIELLLTRMGLNFSAGGSLVCVVKKTK